MKGHFNFKSLAFYGGAIAFVVVLFNAVTAYGNANLKAPPNINGRYRITAQNLPGCLQADALVLSIQQSGIYLGGSLVPGDTDTQGATSATARPSLAGKFENQQLSLAGKVPQLTSCKSPVKIEGKFAGKTLAGQISLASIPGTAEFTAQQEQPVKQPEKH